MAFKIGRVVWLKGTIVMHMVWISTKALKRVWF